jgi:hypothetical protein
MGVFVRDRRGVPRDTDRRRTPRTRANFEVHLLLSISFLDADAGADDARQLALYGRARDFSETGLGLVVSAVNLDGRACIASLPIKITLYLPHSSVDIHAKAVHCAPLDPKRSEDGCILGAQFIDLGEDARGLLLSARGAK